MPAIREAFLSRVRDAVREGNRPGQASENPDWERHHDAVLAADPCARFCSELTTAGGSPHVVSNPQDAAQRILELAQSRPLGPVLLGRGSLLDGLGLAERFRAAGRPVLLADSFTAHDSRQPFFSAEIGVSEADYLIAESGSVVLKSRPGEPRSVSLLPPLHIVVADRRRIVPDLFDLLDARHGLDAEGLPSCLSLITGPSKTGDIELRLVTGVHGPGEIHVVLLGQDGGSISSPPTT